MTQFTAIMFSRAPFHREVEGVEVLNVVCPVYDVADFYSRRLDSLNLVKTPYCFFLDDDDDLPDDYLDVLAECVEKMKSNGVPMAYTNEVVREKGKPERLREWREYDAGLHAKTPMALHHLILFDAEVARNTACRLPRGQFLMEHMLSFGVGSEYGAVYVPRVGYIWNRGNGISLNPRTIAAQVRTVQRIARPE